MVYGPSESSHQNSTSFPLLVFHNNDRRLAQRPARERDAEELVSNVCGYLGSTQRQPALVSNYFHAEPARYAAEL